MNRIFLTGRLTADVVVRSEKLATCSIAVSKDIGKGTDFVDLVAFNGFVESIRNFKKGTLIFVEGTLTFQKVNDKKYTQVIINRVEALNVLQQEQEYSQEELDEMTRIAKTPAYDDNDMPDDDLPF